jgi:hypothetical protein
MRLFNSCIMPPVHPHWIFQPPTILIFSQPYQYIETCVFLLSLSWTAQSTTVMHPVLYAVGPSFRSIGICCTTSENLTILATEDTVHSLPGLNCCIESPSSAFDCVGRISGTLRQLDGDHTVPFSPIYLGNDLLVKGLLKLDAHSRAVFDGPASWTPHCY